MRRAIEHLLEDPLSEELLRGSFAGKITITVRVQGVEGEKSLAFDVTVGPGMSEVVGAGSGSEAKG